MYTNWKVFYKRIFTNIKIIADSGIILNSGALLHLIKKEGNNKIQQIII